MLEIPENRTRLSTDPDKLFEELSLSLSEVDKLAIASGNRSVLKYQSRFGDLTAERLQNLDFYSPELEHEHVEIADHEQEHEHDEAEDMTALKRSYFGPHTRTLNAQKLCPTAPIFTPCHSNWLKIVGTGIGVAHLTREAIYAISRADRLLYCVADAVTELELMNLNDNHEDLYHFYENGKPRRDTYREMADRILTVLREGNNVCAAFYGHPGLFVRPAHLAIDIARDEGYEAHMFPAPSSIDCLVADLGVDLSWNGCQIFEATHFLLRNKTPDLEAAMILLQVGCVGDFSFNSRGFDGRHVPLLVKRLEKYYGETHEVVLYEASQFSISPPRVDVVSIKELAMAPINGITTMYVPPTRIAKVDLDLVGYFKRNAPVYEPRVRDR
jgi:precorrin-6B methylase 1